MSENSGKPFSPSQFMRMRRPHLFSDSKRESEPEVGREYFDFFLANITARKQENDFEHFCRRMAQVEICPNLIPQTGPTGGGDSKVDTETYPVAESVSERWYVGDGSSAKEKWAFAFSAKEDWRGKVQSDVKKIAGTNRGYKLIYYVSNQNIKDKDRSTVEESLSNQYKIPVRILDRNWLVTKVFENKRIQLAVETLNFGEVGKNNIDVIGPNDAERREELKEIEERVENDAYYQGVEYQRIEDCLRAAILSRGLEHPRVEVEGRFSRAQRLADKLGVRQQRLRVAYNRAWTANFWFEDFDELNNLYSVVEELATGSGIISDAELLTNLWQLINVAVKTERIPKGNANFDKRLQKIKSELEWFVSNNSRPNAVLQAKTLRLLIDLGTAIVSETETEIILKEFEAILDNVDGLIEYPVETTIQILRELGESLPDSETYDRLIEKAAFIEGNRKNNSFAGSILLERGIQKMKAEKPFDGIRFIGKAQAMLAQEEEKRDFVVALGTCAAAYDSISLPWAARSNMLVAANQAFKPLQEQGKIIPPAFACVRKLIWIELQLGRIWEVLSWMELQFALVGTMHLDEQRLARFKEEAFLQEGCLAILILKSKLDDLKKLDQLPAILDHLNLIGAWMASMYALGHVEELKREKVIPAANTELETLAHFAKWLDQPATKELPDFPDYYQGSEPTMKSSILGCSVEIRTDGGKTSREIGEIILASLEAFLATSANHSVFPYKPRYGVRVIQVMGSGPLTFIADELDDPIQLSISHHNEIRFGTIEEREASTNLIRDIVVTIVANIVHIPNLESYIGKLAKDEAVFSRAFSFMNIGAAIYNILGANPKLNVADWKIGSEIKSFPLLRDKEWYHNLPPKEPDSTTHSAESKPIVRGSGERLVDSEQNIRIHRDRKISPVIDPPLWNKAGWQGALYGFSNRPGDPPLFGIVFTNPDVGEAIFRKWINVVGSVDTEELIDISLITGISKGNPFHYRVVIGTNATAFKGSEGEFIFTQRIHTMEPSSSFNISNFMSAYQSSGIYHLAPALFKGERSAPDIISNTLITKKRITTIPAWKIDENSLLLSAIGDDDDIFIPEGQADVPVKKALEVKSKMNKK
jgi:hypothetical protein